MYHRELDILLLIYCAHTTFPPLSPPSLAAKVLVVLSRPRPRLKVLLPLAHNASFKKGVFVFAPIPAFSRVASRVPLAAGDGLDRLAQRLGVAAIGDAEGDDHAERARRGRGERNLLKGDPVQRGEGAAQTGWRCRGGCILFAQQRQ